MPPTHQSGLPCTLLRLPPPRPPVSWPPMSLSWYASLWTRQYATVFNQPLSFDTSKVTNMNHLFYVRSARALAVTHQSGPPCTALGLSLPRPPVSWPSISPSWYASLWTRQSATAFNQPLSFDTSKVKSMSNMFNVRLRAYPCHPLTSRVLPARYLGCYPNVLPSPGPLCRPHGMPPF